MLRRQLETLRAARYGQHVFVSDVPWPSAAGGAAPGPPADTSEFDSRAASLTALQATVSRPRFSAAASASVPVAVPAAAPPAVAPEASPTASPASTASPEASWEHSKGVAGSVFESEVTEASQTASLVSAAPPEASREHRKGVSVAESEVAESPTPRRRRTTALSSVVKPFAPPARVFAPLGPPPETAETPSGTTSHLEDDGDPAAARRVAAIRRPAHRPSPRRGRQGATSIPGEAAASATTTLSAPAAGPASNLSPLSVEAEMLVSLAKVAPKFSSDNTIDLTEARRVRLSYNVAMAGNAERNAAVHEVPPFMTDARTDEQRQLASTFRYDGQGGFDLLAARQMKKKQTVGPGRALSKSATEEFDTEGGGTQQHRSVSNSVDSRDSEVSVDLTSFMDSAPAASVPPSSEAALGLSASKRDRAPSPVNKGNIRHQGHQRQLPKQPQNDHFENDVKGVPDPQRIAQSQSAIAKLNAVEPQRSQIMAAGSGTPAGTAAGAADDDDDDMEEFDLTAFM